MQTNTTYIKKEIVLYYKIIVAEENCPMKNLNVRMS